MRRGSLDNPCNPAGSPPAYEYFPHDLDDIYEYKTDHQYFTHTGTYDKDTLPTLLSDRDRSSIFKSHAAHSMDEYSSPSHNHSQHNHQRHHSSNANHLRGAARFDNTSFVKSLSRDSSDGAAPPSKKGSGTSSNGSMSGASSSGGGGHHHHHSIQEMIKHFGKKVHIWPRSKNHHDSSHNLTSLSAQNELQDDFRARSKSLDVKPTTKKLHDWGKTYKIYDSIVKEGDEMSGSGGGGGGGSGLFIYLMFINADDNSDVLGQFVDDDTD